MARKPLGIAHFTCIDLAPVEFARVAADAGYERIGLRLHPAFRGAPTYAIPEGGATARELAAVLDGEGMTLYDVEFVVLDAEFVPSALRRTLADAAALGARRLSVCGDDADRARLATNLAELCDLAASHRMGVDLEVMPWRRVGALSDAVTVIEAAARTNAGLLIDALHLSRSGGAPRNVAALPSGLVRHAQLCDAAAARPTSPEGLIAEARGGRLEPGEGTLPLAELLEAVPDDAVLSVEVPCPSGRDPREHARCVERAARRLMERSSTSS